MNNTLPSVEELEGRALSLLRAHYSNTQEDPPTTTFVYATDGDALPIFMHPSEEQLYRAEKYGVITLCRGMRKEGTLLAVQQVSSAWLSRLAKDDPDAEDMLSGVTRPSQDPKRVEVAIIFTRHEGGVRLKVMELDKSQPGHATLKPLSPEPGEQVECWLDAAFKDAPKPS
jgi:hypothetical protein